MTDARPEPAAAQPPIRSQVRTAVARAWARAFMSGNLPQIERDQPVPAVEVERPANPEHGDLATNLAMKLAKPLRRAPIQIAQAIADELAWEIANAPAQSPLASASVAAPGFLNVRVSNATLARTLDGILAAPADWGRISVVRPRQVNVEFVSANPTGPLTIGNARGAFVGDLLCRVLEAGGQRVTREYYFNDAGGQIRNLGASVVALKRGEPIPEDGYHGDYVEDLLAQLPDPVWAAANEPGVDAADAIGQWAARQVRGGIEASLTHLGVRFDVWKSEASLHADGWVGRAIEKLRERGHVYEKDGAIWFASTAFGDDKDRVIIRSNGEPTYFAADIGYVAEKFSRGYDHLIYIWGADHHGTVARVRNAAEAMGFDQQAVQMLLYSWVRFVRDGVEVSMSKRAGNFITLDELLAEVGVDAARWFFASRGATSAIDFDIELAKKQSAENPVYYVQYAHARIASILRKAAEVGLTPAATLDPAALEGAPEAALVRSIVRYPEVVEDAVLVEETHGITAYATELATTFHMLTKIDLPTSLDIEDKRQRRAVFANTLHDTVAQARL